jgi:FtsP/CotA-like multicopper oxidase with cupredoxin domain
MDAETRNAMNNHHARLTAAIAAALLLTHAWPALAQAGSGTRPRAQATATVAQTGKQIPCPSQQELLRNPELISSNGRLRATMGVTSQLQRMAFRYPLNIPGTTKPTQPGSPPPTFSACYEQWVRAFFSPDAVPPYPGPKTGVSYVDPMAGPTLRARVGDVIELAFLNTIDPANFGDSIDRGDTRNCDQTFGGGAQIYPGADTYPNCFHGSTTANLHFHGTHTNPNTTGDNVFLEIVSAKRLKDEPVPVPGTFRGTLFDAWFNQCEARLLQGQHVEYPTSWDDLPALWTREQKRLLMKYDQLPGIGKKLWPVNERQLKQGAWPQYYFGAYPYCFRLPEFVEPPPTTTASTSTSASTSTTVQSPAAHSHGAGSAELGATTDFDEGATTPDLIMGQAPGTHWYHAHKHGSTAIDVSNGMTGAFIIEGGYDEAISAYYDPAAARPTVAWTRKQPVLVINQIGVTPNLMLGAGQDKGPDFSVNGRINPLLTMQPGEVKMLRIVNSSSRAGTYFIGPPKGFHWKQIAQDGVQFNPANWEDPANLDQPIWLAAGNRADLLISAPLTPCASATDCAVQVYNIVDITDLPATPTSAPPPYKISLFTMNVKGTAMDPPMTIMPTAPPFPSFLADIDKSEVIGTKKIEFSSTPPRATHKIDGHQFSGEVGKVVLLNTVEEWKVLNRTANPNIAHPFHIHINPFQVTEEFDPKTKLADGTAKYVTAMPAGGLKAGQCFLDPLADPDSWKSCDPPQPTPKNLIWWDVFPIPSGLAATDAAGNPINDSEGNQIIIPGYFKMRSRFVDYAGYYVIHCHILAHEDRGMMTVVEVAPIRSPYSHH